MLVELLILLNLILGIVFGFIRFLLLATCPQKFQW